MKKGFIIFVLLLIVGYLNWYIYDSNKRVKYEITTDQFNLFVTTPVVVKKGEKFTIDGKLKYIGNEETVVITHGDPIIRFWIKDDFGILRRYYKVQGEYNDLFVSKTILNKGQTVQVREILTLNKTGDLELVVMTTGLKVNGELAEGNGAEKGYLDRGRYSPVAFQIAKSRLIIDKITIQVK